jgi:hypothetical protein
MRLDWMKCATSRVPVGCGSATAERCGSFCSLAAAGVLGADGRDMERTATVALCRDWRGAIRRAGSGMSPE